MLNKFTQMLILAVVMLAAAPLLSLWRSLLRTQTADTKTRSFDWDHIKTKKSRQNGIYLSDY